jgi:hypothetical protein
MITAYLTEMDIIRALRLPDKIGRIAFATWRIYPSFPKPAEGMGGRWFFPQVEQWLLAYHGVGGVTGIPAAVPLAGNKGENFDGWRASRRRRDRQPPLADACKRDSDRQPWHRAGHCQTSPIPA